MGISIYSTSVEFWTIPEEMASISLAQTPGISPRGIVDLPECAVY
jgi:hypothetical protein